MWIACWSPKTRLGNTALKHHTPDCTDTIYVLHPHPNKIHPKHQLIKENIHLIYGFLKCFSAIYCMGLYFRNAVEGKVYIIKGFMDLGI